jgi:hypothetical protein
LGERFLYSGDFMKGQQQVADCDYFAPQPGIPFTHEGALKKLRAWFGGEPSKTPRKNNAGRNKHCEPPALRCGDMLAPLRALR